MAQQPNNSPKKSPSMVGVFRKDFAVFVTTWLPKVLTWVANLIWAGITKLFTMMFETTRAGARRRLNVLLLFGGYFWAHGAAADHPFIVITGEVFNDLIVYPFTSLFAPDVFRHVLVASVIFWLSLRLASSYLDDIFELNNIPTAEKYILQAAFASKYGKIEIKGGDLASEKDKKSPIALIGGPGKVKVHLDSAVLFEKSDGTPHVIGPLNKTEILDQFERLRSPIDLRDHSVDLNVIERTKDGIHVIVNGARMVFSIARGNREPTLKEPHPFDPKALESLVYSETIFKVIDPKMRKPSGKPLSGRGSRMLLKTRTNIQREFRQFISQRNLSEFLARILGPELTIQEKQKENLEQESDTIAFTTSTIHNEENFQRDQPPLPPDASPSTTESENIPKEELQIQPEKFISRDQISEILYKAINSNTKTQGLELHWIDIGTWVFPEEAQEIPKKHLEAWNLSVENLSQGGHKKLSKIRNQGKKKQLIRLYKEVPLHKYIALQYNKTEPEVIIREMVQQYRIKIESVWKMYLDRDESPPEELVEVRAYLANLMRGHGGYATLGKNGGST